MNGLCPHESGYDVGAGQGKDPLTWAEMNCCCSVGGTPIPLSGPAHPHVRSTYQVARKWPETLPTHCKHETGSWHFPISQEIKAQSKAPFGATHLTSGPPFPLIYCLWGLGNINSPY